MTVPAAGSAPPLAARAKPLDVGNGLVTASLSTDGRWLSLGRADPRHGYVELNALPDFRASWRGDPIAVRRYRSWMADERYWFLRFEVHGATGGLRALDPSGDSRPRWASTGSGCRHAAIAWPRAEAPSIAQRHRLRLPGGSAAWRFEVWFTGALKAHPFPEITEATQAPSPRFQTELHAHGTALVLASPEPGARAEIHVSAAGASCRPWRLESAGARLVIEPEYGSEEVTVLIECGLDRRLAPTRPSQGWAPTKSRTAGLRVSRPRPVPFGRTVAASVPASQADAWLRIARRAWSYTVGCTALQVSSDEVCIVTDHRVLPLSWSRDAYYQALLLLALDTPDGLGRRLVASHLRWLWGRCERPRHLWMRSHRPDGGVKDTRYQADQQLYPLLELADYLRLTGELPRPPRSADASRSPQSWWGARVGELLSAIPVVGGCLLPTEENPADDRATLPFSLSTQILYWYVLRRLAGLSPELRLELDSPGIAKRISEAVGERFVVDGPLGRQWAYEVDGEGDARLYHDANDLPTALAPLLGFCSPRDPLWAATMRFAFSAHNPGYSEGRFGGLGSLHTPGAWTLGDVQELVAAGLLGEGNRAERALTRLIQVASPDGMLPEAYDSATGRSPVRLWFAWPGAILGALLVRSREDGEAV